MARAGLATPAGLVPGRLQVGDLIREYIAVPPPGPGAPLLLVLHGAGGTGAGMAALTGLAVRGPAAGFGAVFPDGWRRVWADPREAPLLERRRAADDLSFLRLLVARLVAEWGADASAVYAVGMSNGALMAEHLAREALIPLAGIGLVAGSATVAGRRRAPTPARAATVVAFHGTADPLVPYGGGPIGPARLATRRATQHPAGRGTAARGLAAPVEATMTDWVQANGLPPEPTTERRTAPGDLEVTRFTWSAPAALGAPGTPGAPAASAPAVVLHRIEGGGHTWPGGAQYLPARVVGPVARHLDATAILLDCFRRPAR